MALQLEEYKMFTGEVNYRLAKWVLLNMEHDGVLSSDEVRLVLVKIAEQYNPPFFELEELGNREDSN